MKSLAPRFLCLTLLFCAASGALFHAQADPASKVRVIVNENNVPSGGGSSTGGGGTATPAAAGKPAGPLGKAGATPAAAAAGLFSEAQAYTHTTKKSLTIQVVNVTADPMDVTVKANFLAKDEAGKHEILTETTLEKKLTIQPGKPESYTTEEVPFTHTTAHHGPTPKGAAGGMHPKPAPMEPASGHNYFGYKVEVVQGSDVVGSAVSENH